MKKMALASDKSAPAALPAQSEGCGGAENGKAPHDGEALNSCATGRKWWDFLSFDSRQDEECQLYIETIYRDEEYIANLHRELVQFNLELNRMVDEVADKARAQARRLGA